MDYRNIIVIALAVLIIAGAWKVYMKAGQPGWGSIVPIYNLYLWVKMAGRPAWWLLLFLVPLVNLVIGIIVAIDIAKNFGKGAGFGLGLAFLPFIFIPLLGYGEATFSGPSVKID